MKTLGAIETEAEQRAKRAFWPRVGAAARGWPLFYLAAALLCTALESVEAFDRPVQDAFFFVDGAWLISRSFHRSYIGLLYTAPKVIIGLIGVCALAVFLAARFSQRCKQRLSTWGRPALLVFLSIVSVVLLVTVLKGLTGIETPFDLLPYGGIYPHVGLIEQLWRYGHVAGGWGFPAGHASGGFSLISLYYLPVRRGYRRLLFLAGFFYGWAMGLYQMARGEHFLSHTLTTMFLALALIVFWARFLGVARKS